MPGDRRDHRSPSLGFAGVAVVVIVVVGCGSPSPSPSRSTAFPSGTAILISPSASAVVPTASPATPTPASTPTPTPRPIRTGAWVKAGDVVPQLRVANLVALPDGRAVLIGIETKDQADQTVSRMVTEMWQPATRRWRSTTPLSKLRSSFASVALRDGRVLVAGGYNEKDASYSSAYLFDPAAATWSKTGLMTVARTNPGAALLPDGRVLVVGGYFYAPEPESNAAGAVLAGWPARSTAESGLLPTSWYDVDVPPIGRALATAEVFDPTTGTWTATGSMRYARSGPEVATLADGRVLVVGSSPDNVRADERAYDTAEIYDPSTGRFTSVGTLPEIDRQAISRLGVRLPLSAPMPGVLGSLVAVPDGGAVLIGNSAWWKHQADLVRSFRFDAGDKTWRDIGGTYAAVYEPTQDTTNTVSRVDAVVAGLDDGSVLVAGGYVGGHSTRNVERYDPTADAWGRFPNMPDARGAASAVSLADGSVMLAGGWTDEWQPTTYRFVPRT